MPHIIPCLQFRSQKIIGYNSLINQPRSKLQQLNDATLIASKKYSGKMSPGSRKRIIKAVELLVMLSEWKEVYNPYKKDFQKFKVNFVTLTVSQTSRNIDATEGHDKLLEPFLQWLRRVKKVTSYVWKAELQGRGQLHYHITTNAWIDRAEIQNKWNELQKKGGYLDDYYNKYGHKKAPGKQYAAPSTKIHALYKVRDIASYICKEIAKSYQNNKDINGKVWDCSLNLRGASFYNVEAESYNALINEKKLSGELRTTFEDDFCAIHELKSGKLAASLLKKADRFNYDTHLRTIRNKIGREKRSKEPIVINIKPVPAIDKPLSTNSGFAFKFGLITPT